MTLNDFKLWRFKWEFILFPWLLRSKKYKMVVISSFLSNNNNFQSSIWPINRIPKRYDHFVSEWTLELRQRGVISYSPVLCNWCFTNRCSLMSYSGDCFSRRGLNHLPRMQSAWLIVWFSWKFLSKKKMSPLYSLRTYKMLCEISLLCIKIVLSFQFSYFNWKSADRCWSWRCVKAFSLALIVKKE